MNFGFRYHVASLTAVFFSLILGILIGGALFPDHILVDEQATLLAELEERFKASQTNLMEVQGELSATNLAWDTLLNSISLEMLEKKTVILIDMEASISASLRTALQSAGAEVHELPLASLEEVSWEAESLINNGPPARDIIFVFGMFDNISSPEKSGTMHELSKAGASLAFIWDKNSQPSSENLPGGLMVDSIDTSMGQLAFILGLARGSQGHYGRQKGAQGLFP